MTNLSLRLFKAYVFEQIESTKADWAHLKHAVAWRGLWIAGLVDLPENYLERRQWFRELHEEDPDDTIAFERGSLFAATWHVGKDADLKEWIVSTGVFHAN